jgi:hypothetical protein
VGRAGGGGRQPQRPDQHAQEGAGAQGHRDGAGRGLQAGGRGQTPESDGWPRRARHPVARGAALRQPHGSDRAGLPCRRYRYRVDRGAHQISGLFTIAATSSFAYKGREVDLSEVGRELGVRYVWKASVQQAGDALRISVQLVEAATGPVDLVGAFHRRARRHLRPSGPPDRKRRRRHRADAPRRRSARSSREKPKKDLRAYDLCLQVERVIRFTSKPEDFTRAFTLIDDAVALDPGYAYARALRCWAYTIAAGGRFIKTPTAACRSRCVRADGQR